LSISTMPNRLRGVAKSGIALTTLSQGIAKTTLSDNIAGDDVKLSREEQGRVKEVFAEYDYDKSGQIDKSEMQELLSDLKWGVDQQQLDTFLTNVFGDNVRVMNIDMFMKLYKAVLAKQPTGVRKQQSTKAGGDKVRVAGRIGIVDLRVLEADLRTLFNEMDADKTGYLSIPEMRNVMRSSGLPDPDGDNFETAVHETMLVADVNKDGKVSFEEFIGYRNQMIDYINGGIETQGGMVVDEDPDATTQFRFMS